MRGLGREKEFVNCAGRAAGIFGVFCNKPVCGAWPKATFLKGNFPRLTVCPW